MKKTKQPIVSVGMPIRNGIDYIEKAMISILNQTEKNIEIIVSDNNSDDGTSYYLKNLAKNDKRIKYFHHMKKIKAFENFLYVLQKAKGKFFMWAAHDDTRSLNYIKDLKLALEKDSKSVLAFGDLYLASSILKKGKKTKFLFSTNNMNVFQRLRKLTFIQVYYIYGLWKTDVIRDAPYVYCSWWPDLPLMLSVACKGSFIYVPKTSFNYLEITKTSLERVEYQDYEKSINLINEVFLLLKSCFISTLKSGGVLIGIYVLLLVIFKQLINLPDFIINKVRKKNKLSKI